MSIEDSCIQDYEYVESQLRGSWNALRLGQKTTAQNRDFHIVSLVKHFAVKQNTTRIIEVKKIKSSERILATATKHKWYLKDRHGMIRNILIPNYGLYDILAIMGALSFTLLILHLLLEEVQYTPAIVIEMGAWEIFTVWDQITVHDGWKLINDKQVITKRLLLRNETHLSISSNSPFAYGPLANTIGLDGKGASVEELLQGTFSTDK